MRAVKQQSVEKLFTSKDGVYKFARWGRPIVPVVFGVDDATLEVIKGAIEAVVTLAGHEMAETDPELGANLMLFFFSDWDELLDVPKLGEMVPDIVSVVARLKAAGASQYRAFRFDDTGAIQACFSFACMTQEMAQQPAETLALSQAAGAILTWSTLAFSSQSPLAILPENGAIILRPEIAGVIRAAYDRVMPVAADNAAHALRLAARIQKNSQDSA